MLIKESQLRAIIREELLIESIILNENVNISVKKLLLSENSKIKNALKNVLYASLIMSKVLGIPSGLAKVTKPTVSVEDIADHMEDVGYGSKYAVEKLEEIDESLQKLLDAAKLVDESYGENVKTYQNKYAGYKKGFEEFLKSIEPNVMKCVKERNEIDELNKKIEETDDGIVKETLENKVERLGKNLLKDIEELYQKIEKYKH